MSRRGVYAMAVAWTLLMAANVQFGFIAMPWSIVVTVAYVWFWLGRFSCQPAPQIDSEAVVAPRWGRAGGQAQ